MRSREHWKARISMRPQSESGRKTPLGSGYRGIWNTTPEIDLPDGYRGSSQKRV
jgi:hypothetical protein